MRRPQAGRLLEGVAPAAGPPGAPAPSPASAASSVNPGDSHARRQERADGKVLSKPRNATGVTAALRAGVGATGRPARLHLGQICFPVCKVALTALLQEGGVAEALKRKSVLKPPADPWEGGRRVAGGALGVVYRGRGLFEAGAFPWPGGAWAGPGSGAGPFRGGAWPGGVGPDGAGPCVAGAWQGGAAPGGGALRWRRRGLAGGRGWRADSRRAHAGS